MGIPSEMASIVSEEGHTDDICLTTESGYFGGVPAPLPNFGSSYNAEASVDHGSIFDFYDGGGCDMAVLGLAQADEEGNINVSKFMIPDKKNPGKMMPRLTGPGGFINISQASKKVIFAGMFANKGEEEIVDGKLVIREEGNGRKFLKQVDQITFSGKYASKSGQEILYVTERCVFQLLDGKMTVIEIAPGIDLQKDIIDQMDFVPAVSPDLKLMDAAMFEETWGGIHM